MRRLGVLLAVLALIGAGSAGAAGRTFTIVSSDQAPENESAQPSLPSYQQPNGPGSINVPFALMQIAG